jgi:hypothetical protein
MSKVISAKPNVQYILSHESLIKYEKGEIIFKDGDTILELEVVDKIPQRATIRLYKNS